MPTPAPDANSFSDWFERYDVLLSCVAGGSAVFAIGTLIAMPWIVSMIPDDYFATKDRPPIAGRSEHPVLRWTLRIGKNLLGLVLIIIGLFLSMPLIPGQGLVMALAGLLLLQFPGKRRLELWIVRRPGVLRAVNWLRARRNRPPLIVWKAEAKGLPAPSAQSPTTSSHRPAARCGGEGAHGH